VAAGNQQIDLVTVGRESARQLERVVQQAAVSTRLDHSDPHHACA
jgi:hypothetical protein